LLPGTQIKVLHNGRFGPFVISIKNSRMAIGRGVADKIMVK
jgi:ferrous iron transport protein A